MRRGGEGVVRRLAHVDIVVRVNLNAVVLTDRGDNLVGVHIRRRTGASLEDVDRKFFVVFAVGNFGGRCDDGFAFVL